MQKTMFRVRSLTISAVALLLILAACGGGAPAATSPAVATPTQAQPTGAGVPTDAPSAAMTDAPTNAPTSGSTGAAACSLLTAEEVSAAYGETLEAVPSEDELYSYCTYGDDREVRTFVTKNAATATTMFDTMKVNDGEAVPGVGDEAWWSTDSFQPGLYVMKGGLLAHISGSQTGPEDSIIQLGTLMVSRM
jgi:hypothetical protein